VIRFFFEDVPGVLGYLLVCAGVYLLGGLAWALIAAGVPLLVAYVTRETRASRLGRKG
jgi:hypothetical protein